MLRVMDKRRGLTLHLQRNNGIARQLNAPDHACF
jgi:hypothetical protein